MKIADVKRGDGRSAPQRDISRVDFIVLSKLIAQGAIRTEFRLRRGTSRSIICQRELLTCMNLVLRSCAGGRCVPPSTFSVESP